jgi:CDP-diacylglycerol--glycerol-3-phosphate 3-phosphatidyltransferase
MDRLNLANALSALRLVLAPILLVLAGLGMERAFVVVFTLSLLTDLIDGKVARWLGQTSEFGARLDSAADFATYMTVPLCAWWLKPEFVRREFVAFVAIVAGYAVPVLVGFLRYGRLTSYHTRLAVLAAYALGAATVLVFAAGWAWPLRLAALVLVVAELEEIAITAVLPQWRANVRSLRHALALRREILRP